MEEEDDEDSDEEEDSSDGEIFACALLLSQFQNQVKIPYLIIYL